MLILSINFNHDGSAVLLGDGRIVGYVNTERFTRIKKFPSIRESDLREILAQAGATIADVDLVILQNFGANFPEIVERYHTDFSDLTLKCMFNAEGNRVTLLGRQVPCVVNLDHFLCHCAAAFYFSDFESAACFAYDPVGSGAFLGVGNRLIPLTVPVTMVGGLYDAVSVHLLGFGGVFGAGKTMGLAPYGSFDDGAALSEIAAECGKCHRAEDLWKTYWLIEKAGREQPVPVSDGPRSWNATYAWLVQYALEAALDGALAALREAHPADPARAPDGPGPNLCLGGGAALNSVANQRCFGRSRFEQLYLHPACGDDGTAIGAALYWWHHELGNPRVRRSSRDAMYSVRAYGPDAVERALAGFDSRIRRKRSPNHLREAAGLLAGGKILGWFQGASEIGPRALGNRSILCDPSLPGMKDTLNIRVKHRETFRPFAPSVLNEHAGSWFGLTHSPFMLRVAPVLRQGVPAITHCDGTARIQTVTPEDNPAYYELIQAFHERTGIPMLLNTSFNVRGDPIIETPEDALQCFLGTDLDYLVFPGWIVSKA